MEFSFFYLDEAIVIWSLVEILNVSSILISYSQLSSELTFENFCTLLEEQVETSQKSAVSSQKSAVSSFEFCFDWLFCVSLLVASANFWEFCVRISSKNVPEVGCIASKVSCINFFVYLISTLSSELWLLRISFENFFWEFLPVTERPRTAGRHSQKSAV